jgi:hypothetical protein
VSEPADGIVEFQGTVIVVEARRLTRGALGLPLSEYLARVCTWRLSSMWRVEAPARKLKLLSDLALPRARGSLKKVVNAVG